LAGLEGSRGARLVALNKIDTLWDGLNTPEQIQAQIERQCEETARTLELERDQVVAISAQKGLLAKVRGDAELLQKSCLPLFENLLAHKVLDNREVVLQNALDTGVTALQSDTLKIVEARRRELLEQAVELRSLRGKNGVVVRQMQGRVLQEKDDFDRSASRMLEVRSTHLKLLRELFRQLGSASIKNALLGLASALRTPGVKLGIKRDYAQGFDNLRGILQRVQDLESEIHGMLVATFRQINAEYGFALQVEAAPDMGRFMDDMDAVERSHLRYLGVSNILQLARAEFSEKLLRALFSRVRSIFEIALGEFELWNKAVFGQLDAQLRERRRAYGRRLDAVRRIQDAAGGLDVRLSEINEQKRELIGIEKRLTAIVDDLRAVRSASAPVDIELEPPVDLELDLSMVDHQPEAARA
jgi:hypothetical protein